MSYLTINGIAVGVALTGATKSRDVIGVGVTRAQDGTARNNFNAKKHHDRIKTTPMLQVDAAFLRAMLDGLGDRWNFNADTYSDKGAAATTAGTAPTVVASSPSPKFGAGSLKILSGTGNTISWVVDLWSAGFTVAVWVNINGAGWHHYVVSQIVSGTCSVWVDGSFSSNSLPAWLNYASGTSTLKLVGVAGGSPANDYAYDDLVYIPAPIQASPNANTFASAIKAFHTSAWPSPYPAMTVGGDIHTASLTMLGQPGDEQISEVYLSGALQDNAVELSFELLEV